MDQVDAPKYYAAQLGDLSQDSYEKVKYVLESGGHKYLYFDGNTLSVRNKNKFEKILTWMGWSRGVISGGAQQVLRAEQNQLAEQAQRGEQPRRRWIVVDKSLMKKFGGEKANGIFGAVFSYARVRPLPLGIGEAIKRDYLHGAEAVKRGFMSLEQAIKENLIKVEQANELFPHEHLKMIGSNQYEVKDLVLPNGAKVTLTSLDQNAMEKAGITGASPHAPASSPRHQLGLGARDILETEIGGQYVRFKREDVLEAFVGALGFGAEDLGPSKAAKELLDRTVSLGQKKGIGALQILKAVVNAYEKVEGTPEEQLKRLQIAIVVALVQTKAMPLEEAMNKGVTFAETTGRGTIERVRLTAQDAVRGGLLTAEDAFKKDLMTAQEAANEEIMSIDSSLSDQEKLDSLLAVADRYRLVRPASVHELSFEEISETLFRKQDWRDAEGNTSKDSENKAWIYANAFKNLSDIGVADLVHRWPLVGQGKVTPLQVYNSERKEVGALNKDQGRLRKLKGLLQSGVDEEKLAALKTSGVDVKELEAGEVEKKVKLALKNELIASGENVEGLGEDELVKLALKKKVELELKKELGWSGVRVEGLGEDDLKREMELALKKKLKAPGVEVEGLGKDELVNLALEKEWKKQLRFALKSQLQKSVELALKSELQNVCKECGVKLSDEQCYLILELLTQTVQSDVVNNFGPLQEVLPDHLHIRYEPARQIQIEVSQEQVIINFVSHPCIISREDNKKLKECEVKTFFTLNLKAELAKDSENNPLRREMTVSPFRTLSSTPAKADENLGAAGGDLQQVPEH